MATRIPALYAKWDQYDRVVRYCPEMGKLRYNTVVLPEVKDLGKGLVGLDEDPLAVQYHYQDIVDPLTGEVKYRRWHSKVICSYLPGSSIDEEKAIRQQLAQEIYNDSPTASVWFNTSGLLCVYFREEDDEAMRDRLRELGKGFQEALGFHVHHKH